MATPEEQRVAFRGHIRRQDEALKIRKPDPAIHRELEHGWLMPTIIQLETLMWGRWDYWTELQMTCKLPEKMIPRIDFLDTPDAHTLKMLDATLNCVTRYGEWRGWSSFENFRYFLQWLLFGCGHPGQPEAPREPAGCEGASNRMYQVFNAGLFLLNPHDYFGHIAAEMQYGRQNGFYPTPMSLVKMMTMIIMGNGDEDLRDKTVMDPCAGTGRFPLEASNYSLRLYAQDISLEMVYASLVNGYFYAPWLVRPIGWLDSRPDDLAALSGQMTALAPPHMEEALADTEHDEEEQPACCPIIKRRRKRSKPLDTNAVCEPLF